MKITGKQIGIRALVYRGKRWWREISSANLGANVRVANGEVKSACLVRVRSQAQAVVVKGEKEYLVEWFTPDID